ncbi:MAG: FixH family protein [Bacteroidales bacterium]|jgi:hypothetical protein|nr:FixH family protein [Bacteroidales bacterium]MDN5349419.1 hypothetical protein [Bacteroidales bacterium]
MKWNWGTKLFIWTAAFMIMLIVFAVLMMREEISLVEPDYYPKGQTHQELIDKRRNARSLSEQISLNLDDEVLLLQFPAALEPKSISGNVQLYHVAEQDKDALFELNPDTSGLMRIEVGSLHGRYILKIDWKYLETTYYTEKQVNIP